MTHNKVFEKGGELLPTYFAEKVVDVWFPNGRNSVRIRHYNRKEYIFTFNGPDEWSFETVKNFLERKEIELKWKKK